MLVNVAPLKVHTRTIEYIFFSTCSYPLRNDEEFKNLAYQQHQTGQSPLIYYNIPCVSGFCLDYMHLICLGVVKRMLFYMKQGPRESECRLSARQLAEISENLLNLSGKFPSEFARQPRSLDELDRWKATEFRQFLLYSGPIVLRKVVAENVYEHFLTLSVAVAILLDSNDDKRKAYIDYADKLLKYFVEGCKSIYCDFFVSYNVHSLLHIVDDVKKFNCSLNEISAFPFENHLHGIKRMVRTAKNPISQVTKRLSEVENFGNHKNYHVFQSKFGNISCRKKDNCFMLYNEDFAFVKERKEMMANWCVIW